MRDKILAKLVSKYPGLPKTFLGHLADQIAKTVTEESQIEGKITELDAMAINIKELAGEFQKEGDRRVTDAKKELLKTHIPKPADPLETEETEEEEIQTSQQQQQPKTVKKKDNTPAWAKSLIQEVQSLKAEKVQSTIKQKLAANEKLKGISPSFYDEWALPEKEEDIEAFADKVVTKHGSFVQEATEKGLNLQTIPKAGNGQTTQSAGINPEVKRFADKKAASEKMQGQQTPAVNQSIIKSATV